jgi:ribosomal protein L11 methyltransferase
VTVDDDQALTAWTVTVPAADAELTLVQLLDVFPAGLVEDSEPDTATTRFCGYLTTGVTPPLPDGLRATPEPVAAGWREAWRAFHRPVRIGRFWVAPPWFAAPGDREVILIEPGRAFGTGAHGSTRAAATLLLAIQPTGAINDLGCGSGVLSIIAARLGHSPVSAFDTDPLAVETTRENAAANGVSVLADYRDCLRDALPEAPLWVANIKRDVLAALLRRDDTPPRLIVSGLVAGERFPHPGYAACDRVVVDGWVAMLLERASA